MSSTAAPQDHTADLTSRIEQARDKKKRLQADRGQADRVLQQAVEEGNTGAIVQAQAMVSAIVAAVASVQKVEDTIAAELAVAVENERHSAGLACMVTHANTAVGTFAARQKLGAKINAFLANNLPEMARLDAKLGACRSGVLHEARSLGIELYGYARDVASEAVVEGLLADLTARGADLSVVRAMPSRPSQIDAGSLPPLPEPWGGFIQQMLDGQARMEATEAHLAQMEAEQSSRRSAATQEVA